VIEGPHRQRGAAQRKTEKTLEEQRGAVQQGRTDKCFNVITDPDRTQVRGLQLLTGRSLINAVDPRVDAFDGL
jgi:hypothetical protein